MVHRLVVFPGNLIMRIRPIGGNIVVALALMGAAGWTSFAAAQDRTVEHLPFNVRLDAVRRELSPVFCWFHPRVAVHGFMTNRDDGTYATQIGHIGFG